LNGLNCEPIPTAIPICNHAGNACDFADADRRWLVTGMQPPRPVSMAAILVLGTRPTSGKVDKAISMSGMVENMGYRSLNRSAITVEKLFQLPF